MELEVKSPCFKSLAIKTYRLVEVTVHAFFASADLACGETCRSTQWIGMRKKDVRRE
jgi:hypothetical protein